MREQSKAGEMIWKLWGTCLCTFCVGVYLGRVSKPTRSRSAIRRSVKRREPLPSRSFAKAIPVRRNQNKYILALHRVAFFLFDPSTINLPLFLQKNLPHTYGTSVGWTFLSGPTIITCVNCSVISSTGWAMSMTTSSTGPEKQW